jgi:predicted NBD/HSP70 family sugar kinase
MLVTVDTGGTKTLVASFSEDGVLGEQVKFPTPKKSADYVVLLRKTLVEMYPVLSETVLQSGAII